jgi:hypothetical protein
MNSKPDKFIPALYGGVIMAVISTVPFLNFINCLCCAGILLGGLLAVFFYKNNFTPDTQPFTSGDCMAVGALAGVVGAAIGTVLSMLFLKLFGNIMSEIIADLIRNLNVDLPEEVMKSLDESMAMATSPFMMIIHFFSNLVLYSLFGMLGGLIGYNVYKPKQQAMPPPPMPQPS